MSNSHFESAAIPNNSKEICDKIILEDNPNKDSLIIFLINIHLILEYLINFYFRVIIGSNINNIIDEKEKIDFISYLDNVPFNSKITMLIGLINYQNLENGGVITNKGMLKKNIKIIKKIRSFSEYRNLLVHGHMVGEINGNSSNASKKIFSNKTLKEILSDKMEEFDSILEGLNYFIQLSPFATKESGVRCKESIVFSLLISGFKFNNSSNDK